MPKTCEVSRIVRGLEVGDCGIAAVARWDWGGDPLYVCEKHDAEIQAKESGDWGRRVELEPPPVPARQLDPILGSYNEGD